MNPQAIVAIILAFGVIVILISGTSFRLLWLPDGAAWPRATIEELTLWHDLMLVIIGALAGYISGRDRNG